MLSRSGCSPARRLCQMLSRAYECGPTLRLARTPNLLQGRYLYRLAPITGAYAGRHRRKDDKLETVGPS